LLLDGLSLNTICKLCMQHVLRTTTQIRYRTRTIFFIKRVGFVLGTYAR
jgi:hypothetical protein